MTQFASASRRIVVGVDFSDNAALAAAWATKEATERGLELHLIHALDLPLGLGPSFEDPGYEKAHRAAGEALLDRITNALHKQYPDAVGVPVGADDQNPRLQLMALLSVKHSSALVGYRQALLTLRRHRPILPSPRPKTSTLP